MAEHRDYEQVEPLESLSPVDPMEVLSVVGDLWLRLARLCPVTVTRGGDDDGDGDGFEVRFADVVTDDWDQDACALIRVVLDRQTYRWQQDGKRGGLLQRMEMRGRDLVVETASLKQMAHWVDGIGETDGTDGSDQTESASLFASLLTQLLSGSRTC